MSYRHPGKELAFFQRNSATCGGAESKGKSGWRTFLASQASTTATRRTADLEMAFLAAKGFGTGTLYDRWDKYLASKGITGGDLRDRFRKWLDTSAP